MNTGLDALVLENHLLLKTEQSPDSAERRDQAAQFAMD